jgi:hypothetical protein
MSGMGGGEGGHLSLHHQHHMNGGGGGRKYQCKMCPQVGENPPFYLFFSVVFSMSIFE